MTDTFHPSSRLPYIEALTKVAADLNCRGKIVGEPPLPKAKTKFGLNEILWNQVMMGDKEGVRLSLELGADVNYRAKGKSLFQLAIAFENLYGNEIVNMLKEYGAEPTPPKKRGPTKTSL
jgi:hypothetical protein